MGMRAGARGAPRGGARSAAGNRPGVRPSARVGPRGSRMRPRMRPRPTRPPRPRTIRPIPAVHAVHAVHTIPAGTRSVVIAGMRARARTTHIGALPTRVDAHALRGLRLRTCARRCPAGRRGAGVLPAGTVLPLGTCVELRFSSCQTRGDAHGFSSEGGKFGGNASKRPFRGGSAARGSGSFPWENDECAGCG